MLTGGVPRARPHALVAGSRAPAGRWSQVLIVDLWHHELVTDDERLATLDTEEMKQDYLGVVHRKSYRNTVERGH